jgi:K(+)-stimulated pyrophosphate-energized sodium pump
LSSPSGIGGNNAVALFVSYLIAIAVFGLFQAVFMANAGGAWIMPRKLLKELKMKEQNCTMQQLLATLSVIIKTSSVALNPIIKFTTLFGLLAMEIAISESLKMWLHCRIGIPCNYLYLYGVLLKMRISQENIYV